MIEGVLFDKDGTLFDFHKSWGAGVAVVLGGLAQDAAHLARLAGAAGFNLADHSFYKDSVVVSGTTHDTLDVLLPLLPQKSAADVLRSLRSISANTQMVPAVPLRPILTTLRARGLRIGLATNDQEDAARAQLDQHEITSFFDFIAGCDSGFGAKPAPQMCLAFARAMGLAPVHCVMVGDSLHDLHAGRAAGMRRVAVLTGSADAQMLAPVADVVLPDIGGLIAWIDLQAT